MNHLSNKKNALRFQRFEKKTMQLEFSGSKKNMNSGRQTAVHTMCNVFDL